MRSSKKLFQLYSVFLLVFHIAVVEADDAGGYDDWVDDGNAAAVYDDQGDDQWAGYNADWANYNNAADGIEYWTDYAIMPEKCIVYNDQDVIVFSIYEKAYQQCMNSPLGTYYVDVPRYVSAHLTQAKDNANNEGVNYQADDAAQYVDCTGIAIENTQYYVQLGCNDDNSRKLSVNIYSDNTCTERSLVDGYDDSTIDVSGLGFSFQSCQGCVVWFDVVDDAMDDQYYENHKNDAPLCSTVWSYKQECDRQCRRMGKVQVVRENWARSDLVLLACLYLFGACMVFGIFKMKQIVEKDASLIAEEEGTAKSEESPVKKYGAYVVAAVLGLFGLIFALLKMKDGAWFVLFLANFILFAYLMRLTVVTGCKPCGAVGQYGPDDDSSDEEDEEEEDAKKEGEGKGLTPVDVPATPPNLPAIT